MKKLLSVLIFFILCQPTNGATVFTENFETGIGSFTDGNGSTLQWTRTAGGLDGTSYHLQHPYSQTWGTYSLYAVRAIGSGYSSGIVTSEFFIKTQSSIALRGITIAISNSRIIDTGDVGAFLRVYGGYLQHYNGTAWADILALTANTQYRIVIECDVTNHIYSVFVNYSELVTDQAFWYNIDVNYIVFIPETTASGGTPNTENAIIDEVIATDVAYVPWGLTTQSQVVETSSMLIEGGAPTGTTVNWVNTANAESGSVVASNNTFSFTVPVLESGANSIDVTASGLSDLNVVITYDTENTKSGWTDGNGDPVEWDIVTPGLGGTNLALAHNFVNLWGVTNPNNPKQDAVHNVLSGNNSTGEISVSFTLKSHITIADRGPTLTISDDGSLVSTHTTAHLAFDDGYIQYYNSGWQNALALTANTEYDFEIIANVDTHTYTLKIDTNTIATNIPFRNNVNFNKFVITPENDPFSDLGGAPETEQVIIDNFSSVDLQSDSISVNNYTDYGTFQVTSGGTYDLTVSGSFTGTPTSIRAKIVETVSGATVSGCDWRVIDSSPSNGTYSALFTNVPRTIWSKVVVDFSNDDTVTATQSTSFGVGERISLTGQSNERYMVEQGSAVAPNAYVRMLNELGIQTLTGDGACTFANLIQSTLGGTVEILDYAENGRGLLDRVHSDGTDWLASPSSTYDPFAVAGALRGSCNVISYDQGEADAQLSDITTAEYLAGLVSLRSKFRTDVNANVKIILTRLGRKTTVGINAALWNEVQEAQRQFISTYSDVTAISRYDLPLRDDGFEVHLTDAGYVTKGERLANEYLAVIGEGFHSNGITFASAVIVSSTVLALNITHSGGNDYTPTSGITGGEVNIGTVETPNWVVATGARHDATTAHFTHAAGTAVQFRYAYGNDPDITNVLVDNSALAAPAIPVILDVTPTETVTLNSNWPTGAEIVINGVTYTEDATIELPAGDYTAVPNDVTGYTNNGTQNFTVVIGTPVTVTITYVRNTIRWMGGYLKSIAGSIIKKWAGKQ